MVKPVFKWAGGKTRLLPKILELFQIDIDRFVEPFAGSAVVSLNVEAEEYLIADSNEDLINFYKCLVKYGKFFIKFCKTFFINGNNKDIYYYNRNLFNKTKHLDLDIFSSALFLYLNRHCFNGLCRYNSLGEFNVPFGRYKKPYFPEQEMEFFLEKCSRFLFRCQDFRKTFSELRENDVVYCDPPYLPVNNSFTDYTKSGFDLDLHKQLGKLAVESSYRRLVISNYWIPGLTDVIYKGGDMSNTFLVRKFIGAKERPLVEEVLILYERR